MKNTIKKAIEVYNESCFENWDGYDAEPIGPEVVLQMIKFLCDLPEGIRDADVVPEMYGAIALDWQNGSTQLVLSFASYSKQVYYEFFNGNNWRTGSFSRAEPIPTKTLERLIECFPSQNNILDELTAIGEEVGLDRTLPDDASSPFWTSVQEISDEQRKIPDSLRDLSGVPKEEFNIDKVPKLTQDELKKLVDEGLELRRELEQRVKKMTKT